MRVLWSYRLACVRCRRRRWSGSGLPGRGADAYRAGSRVLREGELARQLCVGAEASAVPGRGSGRVSAGGDGARAARPPPDFPDSIVACPLREVGGSCSIGAAGSLGRGGSPLPDRPHPREARRMRALVSHHRASRESRKPRVARRRPGRQRRVIPNASRTLGGRVVADPSRVLVEMGIAAWGGTAHDLSLSLPDSTTPQRGSSRPDGHAGVPQPGPSRDGCFPDGRAGDAGPDGKSGNGRVRVPVERSGAESGLRWPAFAECAGSCRRQPAAGLRSRPGESRSVPGVG